MKWVLSLPSHFVYRKIPITNDLISGHIPQVKSTILGSIDELPNHTDPPPCKRAQNQG